MTEINKVRRIAEKVTRRSFLWCGAASPSLLASGNGSPREIWFDHDGGWEDVVALAILLRSPDVRVVGITITPGIADPQTAESRMKLLLDSLRVGRHLLGSSIPAGADILATGPLTAVSRLLSSGRRPARITWMGGAIQARGNAKAQAEWNAAADARALQAVLTSRVPLTICPLDLTNQFPARPELVPEPTNDLLRQIATAYRSPDRFCWDELAAAYMVAPAIFSKQTLSLKAERSGRLRVTRDGTAVDVLTRCERPAFEALLSGSLRGLP